MHIQRQILHAMFSFEFSLTARIFWQIIKCRVAIIRVNFPNNCNQLLNITSKRQFKIILKYLMMILSHQKDSSNKVLFSANMLLVLACHSNRKLSFNAWKMYTNGSNTQLLLLHFKLLLFQK